MNTTTISHGDQAPVPLKPLTISERIDTLDVLRGFALIGILMMNIEWFNQPITLLGRFNTDMTGLDHSAGWFVKVFIEGKFYKLFSLLFGMGFAVMLLRAQDAGRPFAGMFTRRMAFLFLIGCAHLIFLWSGDILHDYAAGGLILLGLVGLQKYRRFQWLADSRKWLRMALIMMMLPFAGATLFGLGYGLSHDTATQSENWAEQEKVIAGFKAGLEKHKAEQLHTEQQAAADKAKADQAAGATQETSAPESSKQETSALKTPAAKAAGADAEAGADKKEEEEIDESTLTPEQRIERQIEQRLKNRIERDKNVAEEKAAFTQPSYWKATAYRAQESLSHLADTPFFAGVILLPIFMFGFWLVKTGAISNPGAHQPLFRSMAWLGTFFGLILSTAGMTIDTFPAVQYMNPMRTVGGVLFQLGQYVLAAGYLGMFVCAMQGARAQRWLAWLSPLGRMALTNYLTHSLILTSVFYGYAGNWFGHIDRAPQMLIVVAIIAVQAVVCRIWLQHFRYGPMEWLWRSATYLKWQPLRIRRENGNGDTAIASA